MTIQPLAQVRHNHSIHSEGILGYHERQWSQSIAETRRWQYAIAEKDVRIGRVVNKMLFKLMDISLPLIICITTWNQDPLSGITFDYHYGEPRGKKEKWRRCWLLRKEINFVKNSETPVLNYVMVWAIARVPGSSLLCLIPTWGRTRQPGLGRLRSGSHSGILADRDRYCSRIK